MFEVANRPPPKKKKIELRLTLNFLGRSASITKSTKCTFEDEHSTELTGKSRISTSREWKIRTDREEKGEEQGDEVNYAYKLQQRAQHACDNNSQQSLGQRILDKTPFRQNYTQSNTDFCRNRRQAPESSFVILYYFFRLFLFLQHYLLFFVIMDARSAMRPCYILPMFFLFYIFLWPP